MIFKFDLFGRRFVFKTFRLPDIPTGGIGSLAIWRDGNGIRRFSHVVFLDYDFVNRWLVEQELVSLAKMFRLAPFYLFATKEQKRESTEYDSVFGNYLAESLTLVTPERANEIVSYSHSDQNFKRIGYFSRWRMWTHRTLPKGGRPAPRFVGIYPSKRREQNLDVPVSGGHLRYLKSWYDVPDLPYRKVIDTEIFGLLYPTSRA